MASKVVVDMIRHSRTGRRHPRRFTARHPLEERTGLVPLAVARRVVEESSHWLGVSLPSRYAAGLVHRARVSRPSDAGRETLYVFMRHWLAARLHAEHPHLFARLPSGYATGAEPPHARAVFPLSPPASLPAGEAPLSNHARLLAAWYAC